MRGEKRASEARDVTPSALPPILMLAITHLFQNRNLFARSPLQKPRHRGIGACEAQSPVYLEMLQGKLMIFVNRRNLRRPTFLTIAVSRAASRRPGLYVKLHCGLFNLCCYAGAWAQHHVAAAVAAAGTCTKHLRSKFSSGKEAHAS